MGIRRVRVRGGEVHTGIWWGDLMERGPVGKPRHRWECNIKVDLLDTILIDLV
jgi:hypothetical protein